MTEESLQNHIESSHQGKQHMCAFCPSTFHDIAGRKSHEIRAHSEKTIPCEQCDKKFAQICILNLHIKNVHNKIKDKVCPTCGEEFWDRDTFKCHVNRHTNHRPYSCEICGNCYHTSRDLQRHLKVHTLPYKCHLCEKGFAAKGILDDHIRKHGGEKLDCRHLCGSNYLDRRNRARHEKSCVKNPEKGTSWETLNKAL